MNPAIKELSVLPVYCTLFIIPQDVESPEPYINGGMDKPNVVHVDHRI
jgi:hypothetical protein